tara:strand:- start:1449 stop:2084 length:636 start_codon:yes stop_codon:yes gene_type:complete
MKLMLFGPQGAGKGTIGAMLSKKYNIPLLGTGDIIRNAMKEGTEVGKVAKEYYDKGNLVPEDIVIKLVEERLEMDDCKSGFIFDGFPRNLKQAELFGNKMDEIDTMIVFDAPEELLLKRLTNRRLCKECSAVYNVHPECDPNPKEEGKCDKCGGELYQRDDDTEEAIMKRLQIYHNETEPILGKYSEKVKKINASDNPQAIFERVVETLSK